MPGLLKHRGARNIACRKARNVAGPKLHFTMPLLSIKDYFPRSISRRGNAEIDGVLEVFEPERELEES